MPGFIYQWYTFLFSDSWWAARSRFFHSWHLFNAFYHSLGSKRLYSFSGFLTDFLLQKIFSILRILCWSFFLIFVWNFAISVGSIRFRMLLCLHTSNRTFFLLLKIYYICLSISPILSVRPLMFDTSGIEFYVTVNTPKTINFLIRRYKTYYKNNTQIDPYKMAYGIMPSQAASSP